jgi:F-type H+-transporting ATPase subunit delta
MRDRKLATRYARALLGALRESGAEQQTDEFLSALADSVKTNAELRRFLLDPTASSNAKKAVLDQIAAGHGVHDRVKTFLGMLAQNGRLAALPAIAELFHSEREAAQGQVSATLTTASPLSPELRVRATGALEKLSGRKVNLTVAIDPSLLGGAIAQVGSMVYDGSLKTQLARLRRTMGEG